MPGGWCGDWRLSLRPFLALLQIHPRSISHDENGGDQDGADGLAELVFRAPRSLASGRRIDHREEYPCDDRESNCPDNFAHLSTFDFEEKGTGPHRIMAVVLPH